MYFRNPVQILLSLLQKVWLVSPTMYLFCFLQYFQYESNVDIIGRDDETLPSLLTQWQLIFSVQSMLYNKVLLKSFCDRQVRQNPPTSASDSTTFVDSYTLKKPFPPHSPVFFYRCLTQNDAFVTFRDMLYAGVITQT